jgi:hypothetical protein
MKRKGPVLLVVGLALVAGAAAVVVADNVFPGDGAHRVEELQRLVRGLGFGPAADLTRCAFRFDPRLCSGCPEDLEPLPGGSRFCPCQGCSIFYYRPLRDSAEMHVNGLLP